MSETLDRPYCTLAEVQSHISNSKEAEEAWLRECINRASRFIEEFTHTDFRFHDHASSPLTVDRKWVTGGYVFLPWPVITLTAVTDDTTVLVAGEDYRFGAGSREIVRASNWVLHPIEDLVTLTGTFGYQEEAATPNELPCIGIPTSVRQAAIEIASALSGKNRREMIGLDGNKQSVLERDVPKQALRLLRRYQHRFF